MIQCLKKRHPQQFPRSEPLPPAISGDYAHAALCKTKLGGTTDVYLLTVKTDNNPAGIAVVDECNPVSGADILLRGTLDLVGPRYSVSGVVKDATTLSPVQGVFVYVITDPSKNFTTGANGLYSLEGIKNGTYTIAFVKSGYTSDTVDVDVTQDITALVMPFSTVLATGAFRVVTTWGPNADIDAYLIVGIYDIIFYGNVSLECAGGTYAFNDIDGYGPETITVTHPRNCYQGYNSEFRIHANSVSQQSTVQVKLYTSTGISGQWSRHTSLISSAPYAYWNVFSINIDVSGNAVVTTL